MALPLSSECVSCHLTSSFPWPWFLLSFLQTAVIVSSFYTIHTVIMQDHHPISRFAVTSANPLSPRKVTFTGFLTRMWGPHCEWTGSLEGGRSSALLGCQWAGWMLTLVKGSDTSGSLPPPLWRTLLFDRGRRIMWVEKALEAALFYWKGIYITLFSFLAKKGIHHLLAIYAEAALCMISPVLCWWGWHIWVMLEFIRILST